jgi:hypothetical protein
LIFAFFPARRKSEHTVKGELMDPFVNAAGHLKPAIPKPAVPAAQRKRA